MSSKSRKSSSLADKLSLLIDPTPNFDPEEDADEVTGAQVVDFDEDEQGDEVETSTLRRKAAVVEVDEVRYAGRKVSRKDLERDSDQDSLSDAESDDADDHGEAAMPHSSFDAESDEEDMSGDDDDEEQGEEEEDESGSENEAEPAFEHFSREAQGTDAERGAAVKNQLLIWDNLIEFRIQMQTAVKAANQMPVPEEFSNFKNDGGKEFEAAHKKCLGQIGGLLGKFLELQSVLMKQNPDTKSLATGKSPKKVEQEGSDEEIPSSDEEIGLGDKDDEEEKTQKTPPKKKRRVEDFGSELSAMHNKFQGFRNNTIQKWSDKTRIAQGKFSSKNNFSAFEQSTLKQIEHILADKGRLLKRTRTRRSHYRILGTTDDQPEEHKDDGSKSKDVCDEIFDDDDFYHQLLRDLIEHKSEGVSDPIQLGRQWIALQKYRSKMKRKIDTRATKGRKIRYTVIPKLVNFMAAYDEGSWTDEAKDELFKSLFAS